VNCFLFNFYCVQNSTKIQMNPHKKRCWKKKKKRWWERKGKKTCRSWR